MAAQLHAHVEEKLVLAAQAAPETRHARFTLLYDALRMLLEILVTNRGYKIYNHECFSAFLSAVVADEELARRFDAYRKVRNGINYYGKTLTEERITRLNTEIFSTIEEVRRLLRA